MGLVTHLICLGVCAVDCGEFIEIPPIYLGCVAGCMFVCEENNGNAGSGHKPPNL